MIALLNPKAYFEAMLEVVSLLTRHRQLTLEMTRREFTDRYAGQAIGVLWVVGHPLLMMVVYLFLFIAVFKVSLPREDGLPMDYSVYLLAGLASWLAFQEALGKTAIAVSSNASLVKQVVFPLEVLPVKAVLSCLVTPAVTVVLLTAYCLARFQYLPWTWALLPVLLFLQTLAMAGVGYLLASIGVYFRDLKDFIQVFGFIGTFLIPAFYVPNMVPELLRPILYVNPFSYMVWCYQDACYFGRIEHPWAWVVFPVLSIAVFCAGYRAFRRLKHYFGSVL